MADGKYYSTPFLSAGDCDKEDSNRKNIKRPLSIENNASLWVSVSSGGSPISKMFSSDKSIEKSSGAVKRKRIMLSVQQKVELLKKRDHRMCVMNFCEDCSIE